MNLHVNGTKVIQVIATQERRGLGTEGDPVRKISQLFTLDGELICEEEDEFPVEMVQKIRPFEV